MPIAFEPSWTVPSAMYPRSSSFNSLVLSRDRRSIGISRQPTSAT